jgi:hypothetical protein
MSSDRRQEVAHEAAADRSKEEFSVHRAQIDAAFVGSSVQDSVIALRRLGGRR